MSDEEQQRVDRNASIAAGCAYARLKRGDTITAATEKEFGKLWADKYEPQGWTIADAWNDYENSGSSSRPSFR